MWMCCSDVDKVMNDNSILFIKSGWIPCKINSHGINNCCRSNLRRANWNLKIMTTEEGNKNNRVIIGTTTTSYLIDLPSGSVCTTSGSEYGPGRTVTAEMLKLYV